MTQDTPHTPEDDDDFKAAELVLGLADDAATVQGRDRIVRDASFAAQVAGWQERFVTMTDAITPVKPHKRVKRAVLADIFPKVRVPLSERLWVWKGISLAAVFLAAYVAIPQLRPADPTPPAPVYATQLTGETSALQVLAVLDPSQGDIALRRLAGAAPEGRVLELWAILPEGPPISLGVLPEGDTVRLVLPETLAAQVTMITLAITDEPQGGAPGGVATGDVMAVGAVSEL